jgi:hypothetical protein
MWKTRMPLDHHHSADRGDELGSAEIMSAGEQPAELVQLVHRFRVQMERRRRADAELEAGLERLARRGIIRRIFQEVE